MSVELIDIVMRIIYFMEVSYLKFWFNFYHDNNECTSHLLNDALSEIFLLFFFILQYLFQFNFTFQEEAVSTRNGGF